MIANLKGIYETVEYRDNTSIQLYDNVEYEAYPKHWHTCIEMILPTTGDYILNYGQQAATMRPGDILLICPGALHELEACEGTRYIFQAELVGMTNLKTLESFLTILYPGTLITPENSPGTYDDIFRLMNEIVDEYHKRPVMYESSIYAKLIQIIVLIRRGQTAAARPLGVSDSKQKEYMTKFMDVCSYINDHCTEELTLDSIAEQAGFSKYHFSRLFKQFSNVSFYKYLNQKRIENAEMLLTHPEYSVTEVALSSGFTSLSSFIRMFKLIKGCTPSEYRAMYHL